MRPRDSLCFIDGLTCISDKNSVEQRRSPCGPVAQASAVWFEFRPIDSTQAEACATQDAIAAQLHYAFAKYPSTLNGVTKLLGRVRPPCDQSRRLASPK